MLEELKVRKLKNGTWEVWDKEGRRATGLTKQLAENQFYMKYQFTMPTVALDLSKYMEEFNNE